jgi:multiple sugar transport system ATP-binding protein
MGFLDIRNVTKSYGNVEVLHRVDLEAEEGEFLVLVGPSGCGKSTLLNMIAGLEGISSGDIAINGRVVNGVHPSKRNIAMVFQSYALYPNMTVGRTSPSASRCTASQARAGRALSEVAEASADRPPSRAASPRSSRAGSGSGCAWAGRSCANPDVFLFDEPLSNLDAKLRVDMRTEIKKLHQRLGRTIVYVTHDQIEAMTLSTRIAVMNKGYVQQFGTPKEIYDAPANLFVAGFMGSPSMNLIPARIAMENGAPHAVVTDAEGQPRPLRLSQASLAPWAGREIVLGIRPEAITDPEGADRKSLNVQPFRNAVTVTEPAGADTFVTTTIGGRDVIARMRADAAVAPREVFDFAVNMDKAVAFDPATESRIL